MSTSTSTSPSPAPPAGAGDPGGPGSATEGVEVRLEGLVRRFGAVAALDGLDLTVAPGELVTLLGPSGCGKTTALRVLAGLERADTGAVVVGGRDLARVPAHRRDMGMVFQSYSLLPHLDARDNVAFGLRLRGVGAAERARRAGEALELVGLSAQANRFAHEMSGGQQQRVALARALVVQPQVLLLDEPLSALDAKVREQLREEIGRIQREVGTTTLMVTHDQEEALSMADRVGVVREGRLEQIASPQELYRRPGSVFVAEFVGHVNRVPARLGGGRAHVLGRELDLLPGSTAHEGEAVVLLRPEDVALDRGERRSTGGGLEEGLVTSVTFLGAASRVRVRLGDGGSRHGPGVDQEVLVQLPASEAAGLAPGHRVGLAARDVPVLARPRV